MPLPSQLDEQYLALSREHILACLRKLDLTKGKILEVGPTLGWPNFDTLDINPAVRATYTADICSFTGIQASQYDMVLCISVLEHTLDPVLALEEIRRLLKPGGMLVAQAPLNFRQHGPQPDLWRFTENGWRLLLRDWDDVKIDVLDSPDRPLFPITYFVTAICNKMKDGNFVPQWIDR